MAKDVSKIVKGTGTALEAAAFKKFGAAVDKQATGALANLFGLKPKVPKLTDAQLAAKNATSGVWDPTPYASALASGVGGYDPKSKFLFKVKFDFNDQISDGAIAQAAASMGVDIHDMGRNLTFTINKIDLPKVNYEYDEVNMYNFRTKVLKSIQYEDLALSFYDDVANHSISFMNIYMKLLMPISRMAQSPTMQLEDYGFAFPEEYYGLNSSLRAALPGNVKQILAKLTIEQFYLERNGDINPNPIDQVFVNSFVFTNPRIITMDTSDQDYENGSSANMITARFNFDSLYIDTRAPGIKHASPTLRGSDILDATEDIAATLIRGAKSQAGKSGNPFVDIIARQGSRAAQTAVSGALRRAGLDKVAGGALAGTVTSISGMLGTQAGRTLSAAGSSASQSISATSTQIIKDFNTPPEAGSKATRV